MFHLVSAVIALIIAGTFLYYSLQQVRNEEYSSALFWLLLVCIFMAGGIWEMYQWRSNTTQSHISDAEILSKVPQNILNAPGKNVTQALCDITIENGKVIEAGCDVNFAC